MNFRVRCGKCGAIDYSGDGHRCAARTDVKNAAPSPQAAVTTTFVTTKPASSVTTPVTTRQPAKDRVYKWREANREHYNAYMRELRRKRAEERAKAP
jgi:hypothetical protein